MLFLVLLYVVLGISHVPGPVAAFLVLGVVVAALLVHVVFAIGVYGDAYRLPGDRTEFALPWVWALATLLFGLLVAGMYWVVHRSTLRPPPSVRTASAVRSDD